MDSISGKATRPYGERYRTKVQHLIIFKIAQVVVGYKSFELLSGG